MKRWAMAILLMILGSSMSACAMGGTSWKEEVLLHDGSKIVVQRSVERGGRHEIGQQPPIKDQNLDFILPSTNESVTWKSQYSEDIGLADFQPLLLDISRRTAYLVTAPVGCLSYNKWGRPNPPYVVFKYDNKTWQRIPLQELPAEIKTPNLIFSSPDNEVEKLGEGFVTAVMVQHANSDLTQPEFRSILREAIKGKNGISITDCEELIRYKGYWIMPNDPVARGMVDRKTK
ncbi:hypothetical protein [Thiobacillus sedimenti]|uniref:Lipoprotein n=1 Tax=Thiobacillus sedimenti TaxID=3110231 RepID=A0ABZ1CHW6_9PROT|nr:hypothetical protein [Thiobacillus sp. SCUT-2]WRS38985.1 hypothetical protein VA613_13385 [Thiobacillus sp. SCUT-2]